MVLDEEWKPGEQVSRILNVISPDVQHYGDVNAATSNLLAILHLRYLLPFFICFTTFTTSSRMSQIVCVVTPEASAHA